ncbi:MAG TPA: nuclear transport factor 2 family protein [Kofleriaceae bacterium]|nr:nuclear transport factor 2 family protein [Kofleriaceae bacterium]
MTGRRLAALLVAAAACAGNGNNGADTVNPADVPQEMPEVPREVLVHDLEATVIENYGHLSLGNFSAFRDALAPDEPVTLLGITPGDVVIGRRPPDAGRDRRIYRVLGPTLLSKNLDVHLSEDGFVGWAFDEMSYRVPYQGRTASIPIRNTELYVRDFDRWVMVLQHQSYAVSFDDLRTLASSGALEAPEHFPSRASARGSRELISLVGRLHNGSGPIAQGDAVLVLLPDRDHEVRGADAAQTSSLAALFGAGTTVGLRDYRIGVAKGGKVAWMAANLVVRTSVAEGKDASLDIGLRGTYVFRLGASGWEVVQMHISAAVPEGELSRRMFGTP